MRLAIDALLSADGLAQTAAEWPAERLVDGRQTAGWAARASKHNLQIEGAAELKTRLQQAVAAHPLVLLAARPKAFSPLLLNCYRPGMYYGTHTDDVWMGTLRTDLAFTLFLSEPGSYDGGELVIDDAAGEASYKLPAGCLLLYDCGLLHRVEPVTRGERRAAVGWIHSRVVDSELRGILFELEQLRRSLGPVDPAAQPERHQQFLQLTQASNRLLRRFSD